MKHLISICIILILFITSSFTSVAQIRLPKLISDGMVLQRDTKIKIWGWASEYEKVSVELLNQHFKTTANANGYWFVTTKKLKAGENFDITISGKNQIKIKDVIVGDVWLASGQSNMQHMVKASKNLYQEEIATSTNRNIRQFKVPLKYNFKAPLSNISGGSWKSANPSTVLNFSAVAYFFARDLYKKEKIPIGIINSSWGGTPAEAWTSEEGLEKFPHYYEEAQKLKTDTYTQYLTKINKDNQEEWIAKANSKDIGLHKNWKAIEIDDPEWKTTHLPTTWKQKLENKQGVVWYRKTFNLKNLDSISEEVKLRLGRISDADSVFVNNKFIGTTSHKYQDRNYKFSKSILKEGKNVIAVRVFVYRFNGGFIKGKPIVLNLGYGKINLEENWELKLGAQIKQLARPIQFSQKPVGLYNAMISPLLNYKIKGTIWYQGESNARAAKEYRTLFPSMIKDWRRKFNQGDFPFLFVQLANFQQPNQNPSPSNWAMLREAQSKTLTIKNTGMAVIIDIGEANDIHPKNKKDVGIRLASEAERLVYGLNKKHISPYYKSMKFVNNGIEITFTKSDFSLLKKGNQPLRQFAIAGEDKQFVWAEAVIKGGKIYVWSPKIKNPVAVRYAWSTNPENVNLYDSRGYPIAPFRTDNWNN